MNINIYIYTCRQKYIYIYYKHMWCTCVCDEHAFANCFAVNEFMRCVCTRRPSSCHSARRRRQEAA